jgi:hypothetical protein
VNDRPTLTPEHREKLEREKGIAPEVIAEAGYRSVRADDPFLEAAGFADYQRADGYLIPNSPPDGSNGQYMLRRDRVRISTDRETGKRREVKMEQAAGQPHRLYAPGRCIPRLSDVSVPLHITEGNDKANALASQGVCALSVPGVTIWRTTEILEKDWPLIALEGRTVLIHFDSKAEVNPNVGGQRDKLAAFLTERGARVRINKIPDNPDGSEQKIDDYLATGQGLADLIARFCEDWTPPAAAGDCPRDDCRVTREQLRLQASILTAPGIQANRRLPSLVLLNRVLSDSTRSRHPFAQDGKPETWTFAEPLADADGFVGVNLQKMAKETAVPYGSLLRSRKELVELGVLEAREATEVIPNPKDSTRHIEITRTLVRPSPELRTPREIVDRLVTVVPTPTGWGGRRVRRCPFHHDAKILTKHVCAVCGADAESVEVPDTDFKLETGAEATAPTNEPTDFKLETPSGDVSFSPPRPYSDDLENRPPEPSDQDARWAEARADVDAVLSDFKLETGEQPPDEASPEDQERAKRRACGERAYQDGKLLGWVALMDTDGITGLVKQGEWAWEALRTGAHPNIEHIAARARRKVQQMEQEYGF